MEQPTTDKRAAHADQPPVEPEVKSGVMLSDQRWCFARAESVLANVNDFLRGWGRYFALGYPRKAFRKLNWHVLNRLTHHLQRRSQRPYRPPTGTTFYAHLQALGLRLL